ncbi:CLUMA_CG012790, isoform A [Clunio marinus]|uniref:CLUMA_CG012790, isoform A n=1 Tax=Clunio marinus TaxID=568069 RepID=A0A1J1IGJ4_9DIPT|nr:CLUMA_CG012790, isoform A [Clunio marinus]
MSPIVSPNFDVQFIHDNMRINYRRLDALYTAAVAAAASRRKPRIYRHNHEISISLRYIHTHDDDEVCVAFENDI